MRVCIVMRVQFVSHHLNPANQKKNMDHAASLQRWAPAPGSEGDHHEECRPEPAPRPNGFKNGKVGRLGIQKVVARGAQAR